MLKRTKIKILAIVGTFAIISTSYVLHANTFYTQLYSSLEENKTASKSPNTKLVKKQIVKEKKVVEINQTIEPIKDIEVLHVAETNISDINKSVAKIQIQSKKTILSPATKLKNILNKTNYLHVEKSGKLSQNSKEILEKIIPLLSDLNDSYIEIEGHSSLKKNSKLSQKKSLKDAEIVYKYISKKIKNKKIVIVGYGDMYPIIDDKKDKRNSRVELKIRRK